ncbi:MAG: ATP-grasp domain-containing protein [Candidatus Amulumruptor sp.]|nr:ATP-grasp domain-containing protein [Candidatus Amulumruptor sp.]
MPKIGVLYLGGAKRLTVTDLLKQAYASLGYTVDAYSYELSEEEPIASSATVIIGKRWSDPDVYADLERIIDSYGITVLLPFVDGAIEIAARIAERRDDIYVPGCSSTLSSALFDKAASERLFAAAGVDIPATYTPGGTPAFPLIAKPRCGSASRGILVVRDDSDLRAIADPDNYLIQEYIEGAEEYTVDCFIDRSKKICALSPRRRIATLGGEVVRTVTVDIPALTAASRRTIEHLGLRGAVTLQYLHGGGRFLLMEINPRLGGGVTASIAAGADITRMIAAESTGNPVPELAAQPGVLTMRCFQDITIFPS